MNIEWHEIIVAFLGAVPATAMAGAAWYVALNKKVDAIHRSTNSMKDALVAATDKLARLEGFAAGVASMEKTTQSQDAT